MFRGRAVFTGLVEHLGSISSITPTTAFAGFSFTISQAASILGDCQLGDSIAVNGCCLTVTDFDAGAGWFTVGLANETLERTNLGKLAVGSKVNLERAMSGHGRFGGHFVQGHVDTTATILSQVPDGDSIRMLFALPLEFHTAMIPKGYVALDGTSLTLTHTSLPPDSTLTVPSGHGVFGIMLIAHTQSRTVVAMKEVGDQVNVECDIVGKGVESIVRNVLEGEQKEGSTGIIANAVEGAVERVLVQGAKEGSALGALVESLVEKVLVKKGIVAQ